MNTSGIERPAADLGDWQSLGDVLVRVLAEIEAAKKKETT